MKNKSRQSMPMTTVTVSLDEVFWRIVRQGAADLARDRGTAVTPIEWLTEAIIERDLAQRLQMPQPRLEPLGQKSLSGVQYEYLAELIESTGYNVSRAAGIAGVERHTLARLLRKYSIRRPDRRSGRRRPAAAGDARAEGRGESGPPGPLSEREIPARAG